MSLPIRILRWMISHPLLCGGAFIALLLILAFLQPCSSKQTAPPASAPAGSAIISPDPTPDLEPSTELPPEEAINRTKPAPDPYDYDPATKARIEKQLSEQPAVQFLPLDRNGVFADISDILPDGRLLITVTYRTTEKEGRQQWSSFLNRHQDTGQNYVVVYRSE